MRLALEREQTAVREWIWALHAELGRLRGERGPDRPLQGLARLLGSFRADLASKIALEEHELFAALGERDAAVRPRLAGLCAEHRALSEDLRRLLDAAHDVRDGRIALGEPLVHELESFLLHLQLHEIGEAQTVEDCCAAPSANDPG